MRRWPVLAAAVLVTGQAVALDDLRWQARPLLIVAEDAADGRIAAQLAALPDAGLLDRQIVVVIATPDGVLRAGRPASDDYAELRGRYGIEGRFGVVLIGKDGGVKRRSAEPVSAASLFAQIDAMPMRQREMREGG